MATKIIIGLLLYGVFVFIVSNKMSKYTKDNATEYLVAGRSVGSIALLGTMCLSIWSALAFYGYGAACYREGIGYYSATAGAYFVGVLAPTVMYRLWLLGKEYNYLTPGDFFFHRYPSKFYRYLVSLVCVVCIIPYISVQVTGVANGIVTTSENTIGFWIAVIILTVYILFHVMHGGNKSVVGTDTLAGFVGIGITVITAIVLVVSISGSLPQAAAQIQHTHPEVLQMNSPYNSWVGFLGLAMSAGFSIIAWPHIFVRSYMAKSEKNFKAMGTAMPLLMLIAFGCFLVQGIYAGRVAFPDLEKVASDNIIAMMALQYAPPILTVLLVIGVFAFGMSTADSQLVVASSILEHDVLSANKEKSHAGIIKSTRVWLFILMACVLIVVKFRPPFLVTYAYGFCAPGFAQLMPALFGGLYWKRATTKGAIAGTIGGCLAVIVTLFIYNPIPEIHTILWGLATNLILFVIVSLCTKSDQKSIREINIRLDAYFASRNNYKHKILLALVALIFIQLIFITPYLPIGLLFGWCPLPVLNYILGAFELAIVGYFLSKNRLYESDGSTKLF